MIWCIILFSLNANVLINTKTDQQGGIAYHGYDNAEEDMRGIFLAAGPGETIIIATKHAKWTKWSETVMVNSVILRQAKFEDTKGIITRPKSKNR